MFNINIGIIQLFLPRKGKFSKNWARSSRKTLNNLSHPSFIIKFLSFIFVFLYLNVQAQNWSHIGGPEGKSSEDVLFSANGRALCSTEDGLYISDDFGNNWRHSQASQSFNGFSYLMQRRNGDLLAISGKGIARSSDVGERWELIYPINYLKDYSSSYISEAPNGSLYYATDQLYKSADNGQSWESIWSGDIIDSYAIDDSGRIYIGIRYGKIIMSKDNGDSFTVIYDSGFQNGDIITQIKTTHSRGIYFSIFSWNNRIAHFDKGIQNILYGAWTDIILGVTQEDNLIYKSGNSICLYDPQLKRGYTLSTQAFIKDQLAREIETYGNNWLADFRSEGLYYSSDAGKNWIYVNRGRGFKYCASMAVIDNRKILVGTSGYTFWGSLYKSFDKGGSWERISHLDPIFWEMGKLRNGDIYAAGDYGVFVGDKDGNNFVHTGLDWTTTIFVSQKGTVYAGDDHGGLFVSSDNGRNWKLNNGDLDSMILTGIGEGFNNRIFVSTHYNGTFFSDNEGMNWSRIESISGICDFKTYNDILYAGGNYGLYYSLNNGKTWNTFPSMYYSVNKILITPNGDILSGTNGKGVYRYLRSDSTWQPFNGNMGNRIITDLDFDNLYGIYAATDSGVFYFDGYSQKFSDSIEYSYVLNQNYPNPFNSLTNIRIQISHLSHVQLTIYNILGEEVITLVKEELSPGFYNYVFDAKDIPSGIYFYRILSDTYTSTKKMILLK